MLTLSTSSKRVDAGVNHLTVGTGHRKTAVVGVCLFLLLAFATSTIFVKAAWPLQFFQIGVFALLAAYLLTGIRQGKEYVADGVAPWLVYFLPVWGLIQILAHTTVSTLASREAVLRWGSLAAVFFLAQVVARTPRAREIALHAMLFFAVVMAMLCLLQLFTSKGRVLWIFSSGYPDVYATFPSHNNFAQFIEVSLPIALWFSLRERRRAWGYILIAGLLYASVIGSASRAGAALCTAELLAMLVIGGFLRRREEWRSLSRSIALVLAIVPLVAATFTLVVGWQRIWQRFQQRNPYGTREEFLISAIHMAEQRPLLGYGLDTFPVVYPKYAIKDFPVFVNHVHNDWIEFADDGGIPFLALVLIPFAVAVPTAIKHPWGLGVVAVMLHACVDFPFPRPSVSGWLFAMLGLLYMARTADRSRDPSTASRHQRDPAREALEYKR